MTQFLNRRRDTVAMAAPVLIVLIIGGCTSLRKDKPTGDSATGNLLSKMPWSKNKSDTPEPYPNPAKVASVWSPETLAQIGRVPTRGFGARVFFYDEKSRPVPVDGTLIVHAFNEDAPTEKPEVKRYEFTPEQFTQHFSQSDLGASYSVWIPWDAVGGLQQRVSLVASFKTAEGKLLQGTPATVLLPGAKNESEAMLAERFSPQYRKWKAASAGETTRTSGLTTTTIRRSPTQVQPVEIPTASGVSSTLAAKNSSAIDIAMRHKSEPKSRTMPSRANMLTQPASFRMNESRD